MARSPSAMTGCLKTELQARSWASLKARIQWIGSSEADHRLAIATIWPFCGVRTSSLGSAIVNYSSFEHSTGSGKSIRPCIAVNNLGGERRLASPDGGEDPSRRGTKRWGEYPDPALDRIETGDRSPLLRIESADAQFIPTEHSSPVTDVAAYGGHESNTGERFGGSASTIAEHSVARCMRTYQRSRMMSTALPGPIGQTTE